MFEEAAKVYEVDLNDLRAASAAYDKVGSFEASVQSANCEIAIMLDAAFEYCEAHALAHKLPKVDRETYCEIAKQKIIAVEVLPADSTWKIQQQKSLLRTLHALELLFEASDFPHQLLEAIVAASSSSSDSFSLLHALFVSMSLIYRQRISVTNQLWRSKEESATKTLEAAFSVASIEISFALKLNEVARSLWKMLDEIRSAQIFSENTHNGILAIEQFFGFKGDFLVPAMRISSLKRIHVNIANDLAKTYQKDDLERFRIPAENVYYLLRFSLRAILIEIPQNIDAAVTPLLLRNSDRTSDLHCLTIRYTGSCHDEKCSKYHSHPKDFFHMETKLRSYLAELFIIAREYSTGTIVRSLDSSKRNF
ncbi:hypothetical protein HDU97_002993 [Phlyctochytrium planicorne]|nr:hypothetical protein HDU97_002993 [Phlyctochytrium planicorne]